MTTLNDFKALRASSSRRELMTYLANRAVFTVQLKTLILHVSADGGVWRQNKDVTLTVDQVRLSSSQRMNED